MKFNPARHPQHNLSYMISVEGWLYMHDGQVELHLCNYNGREEHWRLYIHKKIRIVGMGT
jgi:hypothetical protein